MELRHLEVFVAVAEELSFTRASTRLHLVQSGVSSAIKALERDLGAVLFDRDRHRVMLTDAGQVLLPEARATLAAAQAARDAVSQAQGGLRGTVTVGTMLSTGPLDLPGVLGRFHQTNPGVTVKLRMSASGSAGLAREVLDGSLDLAVVSLPGPAPAGLSLRPVAEEPLVAVGQPGHPLAARPATIAELAAEPFIDYPPGWGTRAFADRAFAAAGLDREVPFEARGVHCGRQPGPGRPGRRLPAGFGGRQLRRRPGRDRDLRSRLLLGRLSRRALRPPDTGRGPSAPDRAARSRPRPPP